RVTSGEVVEADVVVAALGRWTQEFAARAGVHVPLVSPDEHDSPAVGMLATVRPLEEAPQRVLHSRGVNWSPLWRGRALLASDAGDRVAARDRSPVELAATARELVEQAGALN